MTADDARKLREKHLSRDTLGAFLAILYDRITAAAKNGESSTTLNFSGVRTPGPSSYQLAAIRAHLKADGYEIRSSGGGDIRDEFVETIHW